jgi:hypothetical protein
MALLVYDLYLGHLNNSEYQLAAHLFFRFSVAERYDRSSAVKAIQLHGKQNGFAIRYYYVR